MQVKLEEKEDIEVENPDVVPTETRMELIKESEKTKTKPDDKKEENKKSK